MNPPVFVPPNPSVLVTTTSAGPAVCAGVNAVIDVLLTTVTFDANVLSSETVAPVKKPVPVIVIDVPPNVGPDAGETLLTVGGAGVGVGVGVAPAQGSTKPTGVQPPFHLHH